MGSIPNKANVNNVSNNTVAYNEGNLSLIPHKLGAYNGRKLDLNSSQS